MPLTSGTPAAPGSAWPGLDTGLAPGGIHADPLDLIGLALSDHWEQGPLVGLIRVIPLQP